MRAERQLALGLIDRPSLEGLSVCFCAVRVGWSTLKIPWRARPYPLAFGRLDKSAAPRAREAGSQRAAAAKERELEMALCRKHLKFHRIFACLYIFVRGLCAFMPTSLLGTSTCLFAGRAFFWFINDWTPINILQSLYIRSNPTTMILQVKII